MKKVLQFLASVALLLSTSSLTAADTTPPTLDITHTWIEQVATIPHFKMYLDPRDETGMNIDNILFRSALNTSTIPATNPWQNMPWTRGEPFDLAFKCTSCVVEIRARDAAGNLSPVQKRYFASPFPYSAEPNLKPVLNPTVAGAAPTFSGYATDCRGLFSMQFDGQGTEDVVEVDRTTGSVVVRRELFGATTISSESITLLPNTITDSAAADLDGDGRAELVIATGGISLYHNDGLDVNGVVQFSPRVLSLTGTGIVTVQNIVLGDITGEGKPDVIISGTDANGDTRVGWIIKDDTWDYNAANGSPAPAGSSPGKLAVGDMNGDGKLDIVMVDAANNQMIIFKNKGQGVLAGDGEADVNYQPVLIPTGFGQAGPSPTIPSIAAPVRALAIADVTGDGRPDIVTIMTSLVFSNPLDSNDGRTQQRWRLYENRGTSIRPHTDLLLGQSPTSQTVEDSFQSSVLITEMGDDRFPEMVFTNYYDNSIKVIRFTPLLGSSNELTTLDNGTGNPELDEQDYVPPASGSPLQGPSRLASSKGFNSSKPSAIAMTFATSNVLRMLYFHTPSSKSTYTIEGGRTTDSDQTGLRGANGFFEYTAFAGEAIDHTLTATNNSDAALTGVFLDSTLAANESTPNANSDSNWTSVTISPFGKHVRYTVDIPAHSVVVKHYQTKILSGDVGSKISGTCFLRQGAANTKLASNAMPLVTLKDPIQFRCTVETQSDNSGGDTAHAEEWIAYRMTMTNLGQSTVTNARLNVTLPTNTTHLDHSADSVLGVTPIALVGNFSYEPWKPNQTIALNQQIIDHNNHLQKCVANGISGLTPPTWSTVLNGTTNDGTVQWKDMGLKSLTSFIWNGFDLPPDDPMTVGLENERTIEVRVKIKAGLPAGWKITRGTISFARSDGAKQSATAFTTTLLNPLEITLNSNKTNALPGETVRYTFSVTNHNFFSMSNCKVVDTVPSAMVFVESGANDGADSGVSGGTGNFNQFPGLKKNDATLTTNPSLDIANILTWNLGTIPARTARTIEFDLQVQCDVPNSFKRGVNDVVTSISNSSYNFVGNNTSGTRLFAATPALGTTGSTITIDQGTPLNSPSVYMFKSFLADGTYQIGGESYTTVINDPAVTTDGYCTASSFYGNTGAGAARNVVLHDVIPSGMNFAGSFTKSSGITMVPVTNFTGWHFFDATGKELLPGEAFTDSNNNGFLHFITNNFTHFCSGI